MKIITELKKKDLVGKTVLLRVAYDVPLKQKGKNWIVADDRRIKETLPTIKFLLKNNCRIVILSWLGRPSGKVVEKLKMDPVAKKLSQILKRPVKKSDNCVGPKVYKTITDLKPGQILMLENVRFNPGEEKNNPQFAKELTRGIDFIVFDAFAQSHRIHSSTTGITKILPTYVGLLFEKEVKALDRIISSPKCPLIIVLGGAKISDKINVIQELAKKADKILIGGGIASVFLKAKGISVGQSFVEDVFVDKAKRKKIDFVTFAHRLYREYSDKIILPTDLLAACTAENWAKTEIVNLEKGETIKSDWKFLDIGPRTISNYLSEIKRAKTIFWNGPMGVFEINKFSIGTKKIAQAIAKAKATTVIGGGDTEIVVAKYKLGNKFTHISTGGGASMEYLATGALTGIKALK